uniref:Uncharacterized protein n=1 Tax=Panstrongylus lignarius TaxID=156445 RepID=A0A224Y3K2_9HEMI
MVLHFMVFNCCMILYMVMALYTSWSDRTVFMNFFMISTRTSVSCSWTGRCLCNMVTAETFCTSIFNLLFGWCRCTILM